MEKRSFYVLMWDTNQDKLVHYDVLPYLREVYEQRAKDWEKCQKSKRFQKQVAEGLIELKYHKVPETLEEFEEFVDDESRYMFWSRCEYEMICHGWPIQKKDYKLDIYEQIKMNLNTIAIMLSSEYFGPDPKLKVIK